MKKNDKIAQKAILILIYGLLKKANKAGMLGIDKKYGSINNETMVLLMNVFKKLHIARNMFYKDMKANRLLLKISDNEKKYEIDFVNLALLLLYFYRVCDIKRIINPLSLQEAKVLKGSIENEINKDEIELAKKYFTNLYPELKAEVEFIINSILRAKNEKNKIC